MANSEQLHEYTRSQFMRDYTNMAAFYNEQEALPLSVKRALGLQQGLVRISRRDMTAEEYDRMCSLDDWPDEDESAEA